MVNPTNPHNKQKISLLLSLHQFQLVVDGSHKFLLFALVQAMLLHEGLGDSLGHVSLVEDQPGALAFAQVDVQVQQRELPFLVFRELSVALVGELLGNASTAASEIELGSALAQRCFPLQRL